MKWVINAPEGSVNGCNYKMLIQDLDLEYAFQTGENIIEFTPEETGTIRYSCWMGMIYGNIYVIDGTEEVPETTDEATALEDEVTEPIPAGYAISTDEIAVASMTVDEQGNQIQEVSIRLTEQGFEPAVIVVQEGIYTAWDIDVDLEDTGAGTDLYAPYYYMILPLESGANRLFLYPTKDFDAAANDYQAFVYLKVVDDFENIDETAIRAEVAEYEPLIYPEDVYLRFDMSCCY